MLNYTTMLMEGPSRQSSEVQSLGELYVEENVTAGEASVLTAVSDYETGFTHDDLQAAVEETDLGDTDTVSGYLGSLVKKGFLDSETYTQDDIERLTELNEQHQGLLHVNDLETDEYDDLLSKQGGIYTRGHGVHVDDETEAGTHFYLTELGEDILEGLA